MNKQYHQIKMMTALKIEGSDDDDVDDADYHDGDIYVYDHNIRLG